MINFAHADLLSYEYRSEFLGENNIRFKNTQNLSVQGNVLDLSASSGISGLVSGINALETSAVDWSEIILNGVNFGSGVISSISFDENTDVKKQRYTVDLQIFESGDIHNLPTGSLYSGINYNNYRYISELSEQIDFTNNFDTKVYNHSIDIGILTSNSGLSMQIAKEVAANLFNANNILNVLGQYNTLSNKKQIYSEDYDQINIRCKFDKEITLYKYDSGQYTINKNYSYQRGEDGVIVVSEKGDILALEQPYLDVLSNAYQEQIPFSFGNCLDVFNSYKNEDSYNLKEQPITKGISTNTFSRTLNYEFTYSNNLNINSGFFWEYTHDCSLEDNGLIQSKEDGNIIGWGLIVPQKFASAKSGYNSIKNQIQNRTEESYNRFKSFNSDFTNTNIFLINKNEKYSVSLGQLSYSYSYNNDQNMLTGISNLIKAQVVENEGFRVPISQAFNIPNVGEIEQVSAADQVAQKSIDVTINGNRNATLNDYLGYLYTIIPNYTGDFLTNANYSLDIYNNIFNSNISWGKIYE